MHVISNDLEWLSEIFDDRKHCDSWASCFIPPCILRPFGESPSEYCHTVWYEPSQQSAYRQHSAPQHWVRRLSLKSTVIFSWQWTCFCIVIGTLAVDGWAQLLLLVQRGGAYWYSSSVCPCINLWSSGIVSKRLNSFNVSSYILQPNHSSFPTAKHLCKIPAGSFPIYTGALNAVGVYKFHDFRPISGLYVWKDVGGPQLPWNGNRKSYAL